MTHASPAESASRATGRTAPDDPLLEAIWTCVQGIEDPCHQLSGYPLTISDLGIVNRIDVEDGRVELGLTYTEVGCTFAPRIVQRLQDALRGIEGVHEVNVVYEPFPPWTPERLSTRARAGYAARRARSVYAAAPLRSGDGVVDLPDSGARPSAHPPRMSRRAAIGQAGATALGAVASLAGSGTSASATPEASARRHRATANPDWCPDLLERTRGWFIVDGVVHLSNTLPNNLRIKHNEGAVDFSYSFHEKTTPARYRVPRERFARSWQPEEGMDLWFLESPASVVVYHSTPLYHAYWDGLNSNEKGAYLKATHPDRVIWHGAVDIFEPLERVKAKIDELVDQGADGIKFYPTRTDPTTHAESAWFMNDRSRALPVFEYARSKGLRHIAVHKLLEYTGPETPALGIEDIYEAAAAFPDLTFGLVHAGWLMLEETAQLMRKHENVVAVLEGPMLWLTYDMPAFHRMMAVFMTQADVERIVFSSTATRQHPYWQIAALLDYRPPEGAAFTVTEAQKRKILGENAARMYGIDIPARQRALAQDRFSRELALNGLREPFSGQRV